MAVKDFIDVAEFIRQGYSLEHAMPRANALIDENSTNSLNPHLKQISLKTPDLLILRLAVSSWQQGEGLKGNA